MAPVFDEARLLAATSVRSCNKTIGLTHHEDRGKCESGVEGDRTYAQMGINTSRSEVSNTVFSSSGPAFKECVHGRSVS